MALADDVRALRDRALADLNVAHDYYTETQVAWEIVRRIVSAGRTFTTRSNATGTVSTQADLASKSQGYVTGQLAEAMFQQFVAIFENFFLDLLRLWLTAYPQHLASQKIDFWTVLDAPDKEAITSFVVGKELNELLYDRPAAWFAYLEDRVRLGCPTADEIERIAEAKATRDVLVHNRGAANKIYESKAGKLARYRDGQPIDIPEPYHRTTWELFRKVVADLSNAAVAKAP